MKELLSIKDIVNTIPILLEYVVPGFIFLSMRNFSLSKDESKDKYMIFKSIVISYIFLQIIYSSFQLLGIFFGKPQIDSNINYTIIPISKNNIRFLFIVLSVIISIIYIKLDIEERVLSLLGNGKTSKEDCFDVIIDNNKGVGARVYLKDEDIVYTGSITYYDDRLSGDNRRFILSGYNSYSYDWEEICNYQGEEDKKVILNMKDIKRIELFN